MLSFFLLYAKSYSAMRSQHILRLQFYMKDRQSGSLELVGLIFQIYAYNFKIIFGKVTMNISTTGGECRKVEAELVSRNMPQFLD